MITGVPTIKSGIPKMKIMRMKFMMNMNSISMVNSQIVILSPQIKFTSKFDLAIDQFCELV